MFEEDDHTSFEPSLNIVCLNVHNGGGERWRDIFAFLDTDSPDIVVFTEWRADRHSVIRWASAHGMTFVQANEGASENGVFVAAKSAFSTTSATPDQFCAGTLTLVQFPDWSMLACYFPGNDKLEGALLRYVPIRLTQTPTAYRRIRDPDRDRLIERFRPKGGDRRIATTPRYAH